MGRETASDIVLLKMEYRDRRLLPPAPQRRTLGYGPKKKRFSQKLANMAARYLVELPGSVAVRGFHIRRAIPRDAHY
jgi:hypothetical protein